MVRSHRLWFWLLLLLRDVAGGAVMWVLCWLGVQCSRRCLFSLQLSYAGFQHTTQSPTYSSIQTCIPHCHLHTVPYKPAYHTVTYIQFHRNLHTTQSPTYSSIQTCIPHDHLHTVPSKLPHHTVTYIQFHPNLHTTRSPTDSCIQTSTPHIQLHTVPSKPAYHTVTYIQFHPNLHTTQPPTYNDIYHRSFWNVPSPFCV